MQGDLTGLTDAAKSVSDQVIGDNDPNSLNMGERIGSLLNKGGEAASFGLVGDELSAGVESLLPGVNYADRRDFYRQQEQVLERDNPALSLGSEIGGGVIGALVGGGAGLAGLAGRSLAARAGAAAGLGAAGGGAYGFAEGEGGVEDRVNNAALGAGLGAGAGLGGMAVAGGVNRVLNGAIQRRAIKEAARGAPTSEQLRQAGQAAYRQIDDAGVQIRPEAFNRARSDILESLQTTTGFDELPGPGSITPNTARVNQIMGEASGRMAEDGSAALPFRSLDQIRRQAGAAAGNVTNKTDQQAGMTVIEGLDDFVQRMGPDDVVAGDVEQLKSLIPKARDLWGRMSRSQLVDDAIAQGRKLPVRRVQRDPQPVFNNPEEQKAFPWIF